MLGKQVIIRNMVKAWMISAVVVAVLMMGGFTLTSAKAQTEGSSESCLFGNFEMPLPGLENRSMCSFTFVEYIAIIVQIFTGVVVVAGLIGIVVGGYIYMTAGGDAGRVGTAKQFIMSALFGIALALASYIILNTISPQFASQLQEPLCSSNGDCSSGKVCVGGICIDPTPEPASAD
jgi:hypothetical protein